MSKRQLPEHTDSDPVSAQLARAADQLALIRRLYEVDRPTEEILLRCGRFRSTATQAALQLIQGYLESLLNERRELTTREWGRLMSALHRWM
jgi:DNA-binding FrmR family transcriptional regulator